MKIQMLKALAIIALSAAAAHAAEEIQNTPPSTLVWDTAPEGVAFAPLIGDRFKEPYMAMVSLPAGLASPPHVKSADMFGLIVSGTMIHHAAGADPSQAPLLEQGAFYHIPAGLAHVSSCISNTECITFLSQNGKFDFIPQ